jgi:hypothetical protein
MTTYTVLSLGWGINASDTIVKSLRVSLAFELSIHTPHAEWPFTGEAIKVKL